MFGYDKNGLQIELGDCVHCYDTCGTINPEITASIKGVVNSRDNSICVGDNPLALGCAEFIEIIHKHGSEEVLKVTVDQSII